VQLKNMFMGKIEPIMEERRRLNVQIQANLPQVRAVATFAGNPRRAPALGCGQGGKGCSEC
jgi:hypothetical protein